LLESTTEDAAFTAALPEFEPVVVPLVSVTDGATFAKLEFDEVELELDVVELVAAAGVAAATAGVNCAPRVVLKFGSRALRSKMSTVPV
jgi:hypothetical protein